MAEIEIDPIKSWNEIQWIDNIEQYFSHLSEIATRAMPEFQLLMDSIITKNWSDSNRRLSSIEGQLATQALLVKIDLMRRSVDLVTGHLHSPDSEEVLTKRLLNYILLIENSQFSGGRNIKIDIQKIAALVGIERKKRQIETLFLYKGVLYPNYKTFCYEKTIWEISCKEGSRSKIAADRFIWLIGFRMNLTPERFSEEFLKQEREFERKYPNIPENSSHIDWTKFYPVARFVFERCVPGRSIAQIANTCGMSGRAVVGILNQIPITLRDEDSATYVSPANDSHVHQRPLILIRFQVEAI